jgi:predicted O-linked N-acetylglucosamine transferase (SPINDLY family)
VGKAHRPDGASLLHAAGLPELVTHSDAEYKALARQLVRNPDQLRNFVPACRKIA